MTLAQVGMGQDPAQPGRPDRPGAEVLVAVEPRAELGLRIVQVDHRQALEADPLAELADHAGPPPSAVSIGWPAPHRWAVSRQIATRPARHAAGRRSPSRRAASSSTSTPIPPPPPAEFSRTRTAASGRLGHVRKRGCDARRRSGAIPRVEAAALVRPAWTLTNRAPNVGATVSSWRQHLDEPA